MTDKNADTKETENISAEASNETKPKKKRGAKRWQITVGVVVLVLVVAGGGMLVWHNSPSFCGTVCHTPMNEYSQDFNDTSAKNSTAKLAAYHSTKNSMNCLSCHEAKIEDQMKELASWANGNYDFNSKTNRLKSRSKEFATLEFCSRGDCHSSIKTADDLTNATSSLTFNPHDWSQHGEIACSNCHKSHDTSEFYCAKCHLDATYSSIPEGWSAKIDGTTYIKEGNEMKEQ